MCIRDSISFTIPAGKKVALVGSSGSGKSTITKLLLKYYEPEDGEIDLNGVNLAEYTNDSVRRAISYVPQSVEPVSYTHLAADRCFVMVLRRTGQSTGLCAFGSGSGSFHVVRYAAGRF